MRIAKYLGVIAAAAAMTAVAGCSEDGAGALIAGINDGTTGTYSISIDGEIANGVISASRSAANKGQIVTVNAYPAEASAWEGEGEAPASDEGGGGAMSPSTRGI
jgi:hypothetical protein